MIQIFKSPEDAQFYFHIRAKNRRIVAQSEGYKTRASAVKGIAALKKAVLEDGAKAEPS